MSFVSIRCPNCAAVESIPVGENRYQCKYCDNTFNYIDPNAPKVTKSITIQEIQRHNCPICGRGVTAGTSNTCMSCGASDLCSDCTTNNGGKLVCKNCLTENWTTCLVCGKVFALICASCQKLHEKDPSHTVTRYCLEHGREFFGTGSSDSISLYQCKTCGGSLCTDCLVVGGFFKRCKNCDKKVYGVPLNWSSLSRDLRKAGM